MTLNVASLLDKAKVIHSLPSDYKLALVMGVQPTSLGNYRTGKTLPDSRVITKICELTGDDPMILAAQIECDRAKTAEAKKLWAGVAARLALAAALTGAGAAAVASPVAQVKDGLYIMLSYGLRRLCRVCANFACLFSGPQNEKALLQSA